MRRPRRSIRVIGLLALACTAAISFGALRPAHASAASTRCGPWQQQNDVTSGGVIFGHTGNLLARSCEYRDGGYVRVDAQSSVTGNLSFYWLTIDARTWLGNQHYFVNSRAPLCYTGTRGGSCSLGSVQNAAQGFSSDVRACADVKDDGKGAICTPWSISGYINS